MIGLLILSVVLYILVPILTTGGEEEATPIAADSDAGNTTAVDSPTETETDMSS